jgi:hypothetical protein
MTILIPGEDMTGEVPIVTDDGVQLYFHENDIRQACRIMVCGEHSEDCIKLMKTGDMGCVLCYSVLKAQKKPFRIKKVQGSKKKK